MAQSGKDFLGGRATLIAAPKYRYRGVKTRNARMTKMLIIIFLFRFKQKQSIIYL